MIQDLAYYIIALFVVAIGLIGFVFLNDALSSSVQEVPGLANETKAVYSSVYTRLPSVIDYAFLTVAIAGFLGILFLVYFLDINPVAFFGIIILLVVFGAIAGYLANSWILVTSDTAISAAVTSLPVTNFIISHYMTVIVIFSFIITMVFFAKPSGGGM